jgi:hypothetical protein
VLNPEKENKTMETSNERKLETNPQKMENFDRHILMLIEQSKSEENFHPPLTLEFVDEKSGERIFRTKIEEENGVPAWDREYPACENDCIVNLIGQKTTKFSLVVKGNEAEKLREAAA